VGGIVREHVLDLFESARPEDPRSRHAIEQDRARVRGEITMSQARTAAGHANAAARDLSGAERHATHAAGQAAAVAHVATHELGAAAYGPICSPPAGRTEGTVPVQNGGYLRARLGQASITQRDRT
jgi:hypothetical protein